MLNRCIFFRFNILLSFYCKKKKRWVGYKGLEKNMIRMQKMRVGALGRLIEEMKQKKPHVEKKRTLNIETLFSLRESEPEFYFR